MSRHYRTQDSTPKERTNMLSFIHPVPFTDPEVIVPADINLSDTNSDLDTDSDLAVFSELKPGRASYDDTATAVASHTEQERQILAVGRECAAPECAQEEVRDGCPHCRGRGQQG